jgi:outer membrane beta-barrel protein
VNFKSLVRTLIGLGLSWGCFAPISHASVGGYQKATEGEDVIKNKLYPKKGRIELNGPNVGMILNQSYIDTYLINAGFSYFWSETWGLGLDLSFAINKDRDERLCIESFYNDPGYNINEECGGPDNIEANSPSPDKKGNYGPAYVNIREYNMLIAGNAIWNPIYGKEIFFMSAVVNFDIFINLGAGLAMSTFYGLESTLKNGNESRAPFPAEGQGGGTRPGAEPDQTYAYGKEGRPDPQKQTNIFLDAGVGQKIHFAKKFNFKTELRSHVVVGTPGGFDMFFTLMGGLGMRF